MSGHGPLPPPGHPDPPHPPGTPPPPAAPAAPVTLTRTEKFKAAYRRRSIWPFLLGFVAGVLTVLFIIFMSSIWSAVRTSGTASSGPLATFGLTTAATPTQATGITVPTTPALTTATATPTETTAAATTPATTETTAGKTDCVPVADVDYGIVAPFKLPAADPAGFELLGGLRGHAYTAVLYWGEYANAADMTNWIGVTVCNGLGAQVSLDNAFNELATDAAVTEYIQTITAGAVKPARFYVSINGAPGLTLEQLNHRVAVVQAAAPDIPVYTMHDYIRGTSPQAGVDLTQEYNGDMRVTMYFPFDGSVKYGPVSEYAAVAGQALSVDSPYTSATTVAIQAFGWEADPEFAATWGFGTTTPPTPAQVGEFAALVNSVGVTQIIVISLEPYADDLGYIIPVGDAVKAAIA